ncbi:MAG: SPFH domain-containing protein [Myxococcota bacterium]
MGIMDFVKSGVQEMMIARPDDKKDLLVYKHPDATVPHWSQLTVDADEAAVFFRDGSIVGTLRTAGAGQRHTLSAQNIPFLSNLVDNFTGGNVFVTDLFFVTMRPIYNVPFGGELGYIEDPLLGEMVTPRIFGTFSFQVTNPEALIVKYLGIRATTPEEQAQWIKGLFMNSIKTVVGEVCVAQEKSLLQIMPMQSQLAEMFKQRAPDLNEIGIQILQVGNFKINLNEEDEATLKEAQAEIGAAKRAARKAKIGIAQAQAEAQQRQFELDQNFQDQSRYVNDLAGGNYQNYAAGQAMIGAGKGMAEGGGGGEGGGNMMAGAGFGVGMGMANMMNQGMHNANQPPPHQAPPQGSPPQGSPPQGSPPQGSPPQAAANLAICPECDAPNPSGAKFCMNCGANLTPTPKYCAACGHENPPGAKFCLNCGTAMGS